MEGTAGFRAKLRIKICTVGLKRAPDIGALGYSFVSLVVNPELRTLHTEYPAEGTACVCVCM